MFSFRRKPRMQSPIRQIGSALITIRNVSFTISSREFTQIIEDLPMSDAVYLSAIATEISTLLSGASTSAAVAAATAPLQAQIESLQSDAAETTAFVTSVRALLPSIVLTVAEPTVAAAGNGPVDAGTPVTATGGSGAITFSATLPEGIAIDPASGAISGATITPFDGAIVVTATDTVGNTATATFQLTIS